MWNVENFDANKSFPLVYTGHGSIFVEGDFGGGQLKLYPVGVDAGDNPITSSTALVTFTASDSKEIPNGSYSAVLSGATSPDLNLWHASNNLFAR